LIGSGTSLTASRRSSLRTLLPADPTVVTDLAAFLDVDRLFARVHTDK
jgi:hypothetical protein